MELPHVISNAATVSVYEMVGNCTKTYYYLGDIDTEISSNVTIITDNTTSYSASTTVITPTEVTDGSSSYLSTSYVNDTTAFTVTSISTDQGSFPSAAWYVTICTWRP